MTVQPPAERPAPGYYPDPSIPGFVRYWDGDAWTPGSARPAPEDGAPLPPPPRAARGGVRVAPPPPPRAVTAEETGPIVLDETGAALLIVPPTEEPVRPQPDPTPDPTRGPTWEPAVATETPLAHESSRTPVWGASAQAQPGLLDTGSVPRHVSWGVPVLDPVPPAPVPPAPTSSPAAMSASASAPGAAAASAALPTAEVEPDEELASALRLALSQTRRAQLPPPTRYESGDWSQPQADPATPEPPAPRTTDPRVSAALPAGAAGAAIGAGPTGGEGAAGPSPTIAASGAARPADVPTREPATDRTVRGTGAPAPSETERRGVGAPRTSGAGAGPVTARAVSAPPPRGTETQAETRAETRASGGGAGQARAMASRVAGIASVEDTGGCALPVSGPVARTVQPPRSGAASQAGRTAPDGQHIAEAAGASRGGRPASGVGQKRSRTTRPALLGPRIGARLVDTVVTYALVGLLGVVLVQRVTLHLQAKIDAARSSGVPQTVWLVDGTVLADVGLLLAAVLAVGLVYETIPLAVWGRTLGKAIFGLTVLDARSRSRPRLGRTLLRTVMCQTLVFLLLGIFELVPCATDRKLRQSWHDRLGGTFVAKQSG